MSPEYVLRKKVNATHGFSLAGIISEPTFNPLKKRAVQSEVFCFATVKTTIQYHQV
jgi:hypothetical protein